MSITARILRTVLPQLEEDASEQLVRRVATIFSASEPEQHADIIQEHLSGVADPALKQRLGGFFNLLGNATAEDRRAFMRSQSIALEAEPRAASYAGQGISMPPASDPLPSFDVETAINNLDIFFLGRNHATQLGEFGMAVEGVMNEMRTTGAARPTPVEPPFFGLRAAGDRNLSGTGAVELPTGTVMEILSDPNPARAGTMKAIEQETELAARAFIKSQDNPLFLFDAKERKSLEAIFSPNPKNRGALVQILDPETPPVLEGALRELLQPGATPGAGNNFVQILDSAGLPGALIAARAGAPGFAKEARMRYVTAVFEFLEGNYFPKSISKAQVAWRSYDRQRRGIRDFYRFRALPDPGTDEMIVPPAVGLTQTVVDLMRRHNPNLIARDILDPKGEALSAALDELRPPGYGLPSVPIRQLVGNIPSTEDSHLLPLNHPSFDTSFTREYPTGAVVRINPNAKLTQSLFTGEVGPAEDLYMIVDEVAFIGKSSNKPQKAVALVRMPIILDPARGGLQTTKEGVTPEMRRDVLFLATPKGKGLPFGIVNIADTEIAGLLADDKRVTLARNLAAQLRKSYAPVVDQLGERGENLYMITEADGRALNFTTEREHALAAANQGHFVTSLPYGKLASFEAKRGMDLKDTTIYARLTEAKQRVSLRHAEDLFTDYSDIASLDTGKRQAAVNHLARSLLMNEKTLVKHTNTLGARMVGRLFRLEEAIEDLPNTESNRILARKMRQQAVKDAAQEPGTLKHPLSLDSLAADVSKQKELPVGSFVKENLDEAAQSYFSAADEVRLFREMRSAQSKMKLGQEMARFKGESFDASSILKDLPIELRKLANQRGLSAALDTAQTVNEQGLPTSEIREKARQVLKQNPDLLGHTAAERARASRMLSLYAERAINGQPFGITVEQLAEAKIREVDPRFLARKLPYDVRKMIRKQFLDDVSKDPATFMTDFVGAHIANAMRKGLERVNVNISYLDDGLPNITVSGFDPKTGAMVRRAVPLTSEDVATFQGVTPQKELFEQFEQKLRNDPVMGGICNLGDVSVNG